MPLSSAALMPTNAPDQSATIRHRARWARRCGAVRIAGFWQRYDPATMRRFLPILAVLLRRVWRQSRRPSRRSHRARSPSESIGVATGKPATWADVVLVNRGKQPLEFQSVEPVSVDSGPARARRPDPRARPERRRDRRPEPGRQRLRLPARRPGRHARSPAPASTRWRATTCGRRRRCWSGSPPTRRATTCCEGCGSATASARRRSWAPSRTRWRCASPIRATSRVPARRRRCRSTGLGGLVAAVAGTALDADVTAAEARVEADPVLGQARAPGPARPAGRAAFRPAAPAPRSASVRSIARR